jgi:hypothetical protein
VYVTIETIDHEKTAAELPIIMMGKWLQANVKGANEGRTMRDGNVLVMAKDKEAAEKAIKYATDFYGQCKIKVSRVESMNRCQGTVYGRSLLTETVESLQKALATYGCTGVERIETLRDGKRSPNGMHVITFGTRTLPEQILCGYERYSVRQYYPNPLRCGSCCKYGHTKNWCPTKGQETCKECAEQKHDGSPCEKPKKCVNCSPPNDGHGSFDRNCQTRQKEMAITRIKIDGGISYGMARKRFEDRMMTQKNTYAHAAAALADEMASKQAMEMEAIMKKREEGEAMLKRLEEENSKLKEIALRLVIARDEQNKLKTFINDTENEIQGPNVTSQMSWAQQQPKKNSGKNNNKEGHEIEAMQTESNANIRKRQILSSDEEDPSKVKAPPVKKKDPNKTEEEVTSESEEDILMTRDDYIIGKDDWKYLSEIARKKIIDKATKYANKREVKAFRKIGNKILAEEPLLAAHVEQAQEFLRWLVPNWNQ